MLNGTLYLVRGDDQDLPFVVTNPDGSPYNLSGCSLALQGYQTTWSSPVILSITTSNHPVPALGSGQFTLVPTDTVGIDDTAHYFTIRLTSTGGRVSTLMDGPLYVVPSAASQLCT